MSLSNASSHPHPHVNRTHHHRHRHPATHSSTHTPSALEDQDLNPQPTATTAPLTLYNHSATNATDRTLQNNSDSHINKPRQNDSPSKPRLNDSPANRRRIDRLGVLPASTDAEKRSVLDYSYDATDSEDPDLPSDYYNNYPDDTVDHLSPATDGHSYETAADSSMSDNPFGEVDRIGIGGLSRGSLFTDSHNMCAYRDNNPSGYPVGLVFPSNNTARCGNFCYTLFTFDPRDRKKSIVLKQGQLLCFGLF